MEHNGNTSVIIIIIIGRATCVASLHRRKSPASSSHHLQTCAALFLSALQFVWRRHPEMFGLGLGATSAPLCSAHRQLFRLLYLLFITIHCVSAFVSKGDCSCGALCTRCAPGLTKLAVCGRQTAVQNQGEQRNLFLNPHVLTRENETTSVLPRGERGKLSWSRCSSSDSISRSILSLELHGYDRSVGAESSSF